MVRLGNRRAPTRETIVSLAVLLLAATAFLAAPPPPRRAPDPLLAPVPFVEPRPAADVHVARRRAAPRPPTAPAPPAATPRAVVSAYYAALDDRRFAAAWRTLAPGVRAAFGGFEAWRAGYRTTISSRPAALIVRRTGATAAVDHLLSAADRSPCGRLRRTFAVTWRLERAGRGWRATALTAVTRAGSACEEVEHGA